MSMKEELEIWVTALDHYDGQRFEEAITVFSPIADTSKILFSCGIIRATLGEHQQAVEFYQRAIALDQYLAIAYFQQGVSNFLLGDFEEALVNFNDALLFLRGNKHIDYDQLGLKYKLWSCEVIFNRGLCYIYLQQTEVGMADLGHAQKEKAVPEHDVIDEAIKDKATGYTVFSMPVGLVFRPNEGKIRNIRARDYLGKARLIRQASKDAMHRRQMSADVWARDDRPQEKLSYAASNLVRPGMRSRQQSEPPTQRNVYPPTPPPELNDQPRRRSPDRTGGTSRSQSLSRKPEPLNLGRSSFHSSAYGLAVEKPRRGATRSASERPSERRPYIDRRSTDDSLRSTRSKLYELTDHDESLTDSLVSRLREATASPSKRAQKQQSPYDLIQEEEGESPSYDLRSSTSTYAEMRDDNSSIYSRRSQKGPPSMSKIRAKVHAQDTDDTRYIMLQPTITFSELIDMVAKKFKLSGTGLKLKLQDEDGDKITMGDQDDLDMAITMCKDVASKERVDMGKLELWVRAG